MKEDVELLRRYADTADQAAFAELVQRHLNLVYSAALRQVGGDAHLAEDVAQSVFTDLARKAAALAGRSVLAGWLYTSTSYAAAKAVRTEQRRRAREQEAHAMQQLTSDPTSPADWEKLRPVLDAAMRDLNDRDREAVLLRFFEGRGFVDIGARLHLTENAARMRVERALEKLHGLLARRGVTSTATALAAALASQAVAAAPAGLVSTVTSAALAGASTGGGALTLLTLMSTAQVQIGIGGALLAAGALTFVVQQQANARMKAEIAGLRTQTAPIAQLRADNQALSRTAAEVESLRRDDAELVRLRDEATALKARFTQATGPQPPRPASDAGASAAGPVYDLRVLDRLPTPTFQARPVYPFELRRFGIRGEATMSFVVGADGSVRDIKAVKSTHSAFEAAAAAALQKWKFRPAQKGGAPVNVRLQVPIVFDITSDNAKWF